MKVSWIYRALMFMFVGFAIGAGVSGYVTTRVLLNNLPPTQEITIGKQKLRGRDNTLETVIAPTIEAPDLTRKEKRKIRRENR